MDEATEGIADFTSSLSAPLERFVGSLNASIDEVQLLLSTTGEWLSELEQEIVVRLDSFDSAHR